MVEGHVPQGVWVRLPPSALEPPEGGSFFFKQCGQVHMGWPSLSIDDLGVLCKGIIFIDTSKWL